MLPLSRTVLPARIPRPYQIQRRGYYEGIGNIIADAFKGIIILGGVGIGISGYLGYQYGKRQTVKPKINPLLAPQ